MKNKELKKYLYLGITIFISIYIATSNSDFTMLRDVWDKLVKILMPITYGMIMAFLLAPIYNKTFEFINNIVLKKIKIKNETKIKITKVLSTFVCIILIIVALMSLVMMIIPELISSITTMIDNLPNNFEKFEKFIETFIANNPNIESTFATTYEDVLKNIEDFFKKSILPNLNQYLSGISFGIFKVIGHIVNFLIGCVVMTYLLNMKEVLLAQIKKICYGMFSLEVANNILKEARYVKFMFSQFIVGKIIDSIIIAIINYIFMSMLHMKYSLLISVVIGITNVIPFFGPFIGAVPSVFILLLVSPVSALIFVVWILVLQQIDGNIIGPKILGQTTGLASFWILFSILLFGGLFGVVGMIIAVPTWAVIYKIIGTQIKKRLRKKDLLEESIEYANLKYIDEQTKDYIKK